MDIKSTEAEASALARGRVVLVYVKPNIPLSASIVSRPRGGKVEVRIVEFNRIRFVDPAVIVPPCGVTDDSCWDEGNCRHCKLPRQHGHQPGCSHWDFERNA